MNRTVLVVDDEDAVRNSVRLVLEDSGFTVLDAADGAESLCVLRRHGGAVDVAVVDLSLPGMGGLETIEALRQERPGIRTIIFTGWGCVAPEKLSGAGVDAVMAKPFSTLELIKMVESLLAH